MDTTELTENEINFVEFLNQCLLPIVYADYVFKHLTMAIDESGSNVTDSILQLIKDVPQVLIDIKTELSQTDIPQEGFANSMRNSQKWITIIVENYQKVSSIMDEFSSILNSTNYIVDENYEDINKSFISKGHFIRTMEN